VNSLPFVTWLDIVLSLCADHSLFSLCIFHTIQKYHYFRRHVKSCPSMWAINSISTATTSFATVYKGPLPFDFILKLHRAHINISSTIPCYSFCVLSFACRIWGRTLFPPFIKRCTFALCLYSAPKSILE
jgi:hypothetical protein